MTSRELWFPSVGLFFRRLLQARRVQRDQDDAERARRAEMVRGWLLRTVAMLLHFYAALVGVLAFGLLIRFLLAQMLLRSEPLDLKLLLLIPALAAFSAGLGWIGLRMGRAGSLVDRCVQAFATAADAFCSAKPAAGKPEPAGGAFRDLD